MRLHRFAVLGQHRLLDARDDAFVGDIDAVDLDLGRLLIEQVVQLTLGELLDRLVRVIEAAAHEDAAIPAVHRVARDLQRPLAQRLVLVINRRVVEVAHLAHALAARAHAALDAELPALLDLLPRLGHRHGARAGDGGDVEGEGLGRADIRLPEPAEQDAQHGVDIGDRADGRANVGPHPFLVNDDRRRQPLQQVDIRPGERGHKALYEGRISLVDHPLALGRDGGKDQRALARAGHSGEDRQPPLGQLNIDLLEVVLPCPDDADQVVRVGRMLPARLSFRARHRLCSPSCVSVSGIGPA